MENKFFDYVKYDSTFDKKYGDFCGSEEALTLSERIEYIKHYSQFLSTINGKHGDAYATKVVTDKEVEGVASQIGYVVSNAIRKRDRLTDFNAYLKDQECDFQGWQVYGGAKIVENIVVLQDGIVPPVANAKFEFENNGLSELSFSVYIPKTFLSLSKRNGKYEKTLCIDSGRIIELRSGISDVLKLQFYANGELKARVGVPDPYHPVDVLLGAYSVDCWNDIKILFCKDNFRVMLNGNTIGQDLSYTNILPPDTLFVSGGKHPNGTWKFKLNAFNGDKYIFTAQSEKRKETVDFLGKVVLPFAVGGEKNKDKKLVLGAEFIRKKGRAILNIGSLDPCGEVYINGVKAFETNSFFCVSKDVSHLIIDGTNKISIVVFPRAPEVNYLWHRHKDPYNAWFCREVFIDWLPDSYISDITLQTTSVGNGTVSAKLSLKFSGLIKNKKYSIKIWLKKTFPNQGEDFVLWSGKVCGDDFNKRLRFFAESWSPDAPNLYAVRAELICDNVSIDDCVTETGFRTISQKNGNIVLNGKKILLTGGLIMQFLPPYDDIVKNHLCPNTAQIIMQILEVKKMNGNTARLHQLGYGTNDSRFASICDRLGIMLIWTTRLIDSVESVSCNGEWKQKNHFVSQIREVINHPSIIVWEGCNEFHASEFNINCLFDEFVSAVKTVDSSRLMSPCSHLYYGGGIYGDDGFYYQDDGELNQNFQKCKASFGWKDGSVIRSSHTYEILLGYGGDWKSFREQNWKTQELLFKSKKHAYLITEFAVIGKHNDTTEECKRYVKNDSYELSDLKKVFGEEAARLDYKLSQAYQALCAFNIVKHMRAMGVDGLLWCAMHGGANDGSYLKPPIDFYGYAKQAFFALKLAFSQTVCYNKRVDIIIGKNYEFEPIIVGMDKNTRYDVDIRVLDEGFRVVDSKEYKSVKSKKDCLKLQKFKINAPSDGYYCIEYILKILDKNKKSGPIKDYYE